MDNSRPILTEPGVKYFLKETKEFVLCDDSGFVVSDLKNYPGIKTAREAKKMGGEQKVIDFIFENFRSNFFIIIKSTLRFLRLSIFCCKLDILKLSRFLLKNIFGIGSKVSTPIFEEYLFLYSLANENNF